MSPRPARARRRAAGPGHRVYPAPRGRRQSRRRRWRMEPRLTRDTRHAVLGGVAAGLASYFSVDPVLTRLVFILLTAMSGAGIVAYVVAWIIMPKSESTAGGTAGPPHIPPPADRIAA